MYNIKPRYYNEILLFIGTRIKMIFNKNLHIINILPAFNTRSKTFSITIFFKFMNKNYKFIHSSILDINDTMNIINIIIDEFEQVIKKIK